MGSWMQRRECEVPRTPMRRRMRRRKLETEGSVRLTHPIQHQQQFSRGRTSGCGVAVRTNEEESLSKKDFGIMRESKVYMHIPM
ncbi:hypothetical protein SORBI_3004G238000 [Sorghum bicolor]|uniref:Uncharacterized protein n=1 Tax=Sorghum bicolor TaxID=4558 RepID=A0A194YRA5_SORBI|nr:hypothetical protein SORBI_3004G238000 [Sorghum bicolor]